MNNSEVLVWLNTIGFSNKKTWDIIAFMDEIKHIPLMSKGDLINVGISENDSDFLIRNKNYDKMSWLYEYYAKLGVRIMTIFDDDYPKNLAKIDNAPLVLYIKGKIIEEDNRSIAIVGSRQLSDYGRQACQFISREMALNKITIVSGLANGADSIAHETSLKYKNRTIAVMGTGIDVIYPSKNKRLFDEITEKGAVITEFPAGTKGLPYNFPRRNRIISGITLGTIVVEAKEKSGTLITAGYAGEQGREVFAIPGNINSIYSKGTNKLIQDGAKLVMNARDVFSEIKEFENFIKSEEKNQGVKFEGDEKKVIDVLMRGEVTLELILQETNLEVQNIQTILAKLELMDVITTSRRGTYLLNL